MQTRVIILLLGILFISLFVSTKMATEGFDVNGGNLSDIKTAVVATGGPVAGGPVSTGPVAGGPVSGDGNDGPLPGSIKPRGDYEPPNPGASNSVNLYNSVDPSYSSSAAAKVDDPLMAQSVDYVVGKVTDKMKDYTTSMLKSFLNTPVVPTEGFTSVPFSQYS